MDSVTRYHPTERHLRRDLRELQLILADATTNLSDTREPPLCTTEMDRPEMAGRPWVRLDTGYFRNAKIRRAGTDAALLHLAAICYLGNQEIGDGLLPAEVVDVLAAEVKIRNPELIVARLVKSELWHKRDGDWLVHDYDMLNGDRSEAAAARDRQRRSRSSRRDPESGKFE